MIKTFKIKKYSQNIRTAKVRLLTSRMSVRARCYVIIYKACVTPTGLSCTLHTQHYIKINFIFYISCVLF